jgi:uncharacterized protein with von Willebrand factor type A (vWA) domain
MTLAPTADPPLLGLFLRLREAGLPLGIDEYLLAVRGLQAGFGEPDRAALRRFCAALWVKSADDERLFAAHFDEALTAAASNEANSRPPGDKLEVASEAGPSRTDTDVEAAAPSGRGLPVLLTALARQVDDEVQAAAAVAQVASSDTEARGARYLLTSDYLPVTKRQMKQSWRFLRQQVREGPPEEVDVEATIDHICREGFLIEPVRVPRRTNRAELVLLMDTRGSMVPFHDLGRRLIQTAERGGRLGRAGVFYFHDCPTEFLYSDAARHKGTAIDRWLVSGDLDRSRILIFSDGGAARGHFDRERLALTAGFLEKLNRRVRRVAWLNPMPRTRWTATTAEAIARLVPMFEVSQHGLHEAIRVLRGLAAHDR